VVASRGRALAGRVAVVKGALKNQEQVAAYLRQHPGQRLRYEQIAAAVQLSNQQASIALSGLLRDDTLPGLRRVGRGTYQWDPPDPADCTACTGSVADADNERLLSQRTGRLATSRRFSPLQRRRSRQSAQSLQPTPRCRT
jgi:hypothetical protein